MVKDRLHSHIPDFSELLINPFSAPRLFFFLRIRLISQSEDHTLDLIDMLVYIGFQNTRPFILHTSVSNCVFSSQRRDFLIGFTPEKQKGKMFLRVWRLCLLLFRYSGKKQGRKTKNSLFFCLNEQESIAANGSLRLKWCFGLSVNISMQRECMVFLINVKICIYFCAFWL